MSKKKPDIEVKHGTESESTQSWPQMMTLRREIDRLFDDFGAGFGRQTLTKRMHDLLPSYSSWTMTPVTEIAECDGEYRITSELPGIAPEDVEIRLSDGMITIRGEKSEEKKGEKEDYLVSERHYGEFQRKLALPLGIDGEKASASFANGVLTVTLPKSIEAKQKERKIEIKAA